MNTLSPAKSRKPASLSARTISMTAMLTAVSYLLAFVEFPVPLSPSFARMDLSDLPALIGAFAFGPLTGLLIELVKNALQLFTSSTGGVGEIANFLMGASYVVAAGLTTSTAKQRTPHGSPASSQALSWALRTLWPTTSFCCRCSRISCPLTSSSPLLPSFCPLSIQSWMWCSSMHSPLICSRGL